MRLLEDNPGTNWQELADPETQREFTKQMRTWLDKSQDDLKNDDAVFGRALDLFANDPRQLAEPTRAEFDSEWKPKLSKRNQARIDDLRLRAQQGLLKQEADERKQRQKEVKLKRRQTDVNIMKTGLRRSGIIPWTGDLSEQEHWKQARFFEEGFKRISQLERQRQEDAARTGKFQEITDDDVQNIVNDMLRVTVMTREIDELPFGFLGFGGLDVDWLDADEQRVLFSLNEEELSRAYVADVKMLPDRANKEIEKDLRSVNKMITSEKKVRLYNALYISQDTNLYNEILKEP
jgi:hypothetical protein